MSRRYFRLRLIDKLGRGLETSWERCGGSRLYRRGRCLLVIANNARAVVMHESSRLITSTARHYDVRSAVIGCTTHVTVT